MMVNQERPFGAADGDRPSMREETWELLVDSITSGECTPFLGAGVSVPYLPRGSELATSLAQECDYPLADETNLARVSQYIASLVEPKFLKRRVYRKLADAQEAASEKLHNEPPENHAMLARLDLPLYITTNYDSYLEQAISARPTRTPTVEICRWNDRLSQDLPKYGKVEPTRQRPTIFHMHGHMSVPSSIVITEDDYIDFTVSLGQRALNKSDPVIPHFIRRALANTNLLFLGYSLEDWNFRVLMRHLIKQQALVEHDRYSCLSIQLSDSKMPPQKRELAERFLEKYLKTSTSIDVYWGDAHTFLAELLHRIESSRRPEGRSA